MSQGAKVTTGGKRNPDFPNGLFYLPTVSGAIDGRPDRRRVGAPPTFASASLIFDATESWGGGGGGQTTFDATCVV